MRQTNHSRVKDYVDTFSNGAGRRVLDDLHLSYCGPSFNSDALEMARREGRREVVLSILRLLKMDNKIMELEREGDD